MVGSGLIRQWFCSGSTQKLKLQCSVHNSNSRTQLSPSLPPMLTTTVLLLDMVRLMKIPTWARTGSMTPSPGREVVDLLTHSE